MSLRRHHLDETRRDAGTAFAVPPLVSLRVGDGLLSIETFAERIELAFRDRTGAPALSAAQLCDGLARLQLDDASDDPGGRKLRGALAEQGLLLPRATPADVAPDALLAGLQALFGELNRALFGHPLWQDLLSGAAPRRLIEGWVIETYHFIAGVQARLPCAVAHCSAGPQREILVTHYCEEYDHDGFFRAALAQLGFPVGFEEALLPLPGTQAVIDFMRAAARDDILGYAVCSGLLESTGSDAANGRAFYRHLATRYPELAAVFQPMLDHVALDFDYGHGHFLKDLLALEPPLPGARADRLAATLFAFAATLRLWFDDIQRFYAVDGGGDGAQAQAQEAPRYRRPATPPYRRAPTPPYRLPDGPVPILSHDVAVTADAQSLRVDTAGERLTFTGAGATHLAALLPRIDGARGLPELVAESGLAGPALVRLLDPLREAGCLALCDPAGGPAVRRESFAATARLFNRNVFAGRFFQRLEAGTLERAQVLGWAVEFTHFIAAANRYMSAGVARIPPRSPLARAAAAHYVEEAGHYAIFRRGLTACGLDAALVEAAPPLASTQALINALSELAFASEIEYLALFAVMRPLQGPGALREEPAALSRLAALYPYAAGFFAALAEHAAEDQALGHGAPLIYELLELRGDDLTPAAWWRAVGALRRTAEAFELFYDGLLDSYALNALVPRPPLVWSALAPLSRPGAAPTAQSGHDG